MSAVPAFSTHFSSYEINFVVIDCILEYLAEHWNLHRLVADDNILLYISKYCKKGKNKRISICKYSYF
jgi:hypothetical protein